MTETPPLLRVDRLRTILVSPTGTPVTAVDDVSFDLSRGETLGLVGESGSGKSITALSIMRLIAPPGRIASGRIELDGLDLCELGAEDMRRIRGRRIGMAFQEPAAALNPVLTIGYQLAETLEVHGLARGRAARERAVELLELVRLPDPSKWAQAYSHELSGGSRQRAMIALAIAAEPSLLIADEPSTALDVSIQADILDLLRDMKRTIGLALLLITHDFGVIAEMADRVAVMSNGRLVEQGSVDQILQRPSDPHTQHLLSFAPREIAAGAKRAPLGRPSS